MNSGSKRADDDLRKASTRDRRASVDTSYPLYRWAGFVAGPALAIALLAALYTPANSAGTVAAVGVWMAVWWMTQALPIATTALLPLVLFPLLGIASLETTATSYAHPLIFLFLGGFMLARAIEVWGLHKRIAFQILRFGGSSPL